MSLLPCRIRSLSHTRVCWHGRQRRSVSLCMSERVSVVSSLCQPAPRCRGAHLCTAPKRSGGGASSLQGPPHTPCRFCPEALLDLRQKDPLFPESCQLFTRSPRARLLLVELMADAHRALPVSTSESSPAAGSWVQRDWHKHGTRAALHRGAGGSRPRQPSRPDKLSSCWDRLQGQPVPDKCAINTVTAA